MVLNTPSYGGGSDLWDEARAAPLRASTKPFAQWLVRTGRSARPLRMDDGCLEVVGVTNVLHLAATLGGISNGVRLCQGRRLTIAVPGGGVPLQIDGEPFNVRVPATALSQPGRGLEPFTLELVRDGQALMLARTPRATAREGNALTAVEAQLRERGLSTPQRDALIWQLAGSESVRHAGTEATQTELQPVGARATYFRAEGRADGPLGGAHDSADGPLAHDSENDAPPLVAAA